MLSQISYFESYADDNFELLQLFALHAKRVQGVKGIFEAHKQAAKIAETQNFYVIDADAVIDEQFNFNFTPGVTEEAYPGVREVDCVFVWRSLNPINDLLYGYGGAKLFPQSIKRSRAMEYRHDPTLGCLCAQKVSGKQYYSI